ncbi:MAG: hypothetical protein R3D67_13525 [Hyphomicrobiaceae bacterium]
MNRNILGGLAAGLVAIAALAAPAQAGYKSFKHGHGHRHHVTKHFGHHKFHAYRHAYRVPVCIKHKWVYTYDHGKKLVCVIWR